MPIPENANSVMLLRPITTAPAARKRATAGASTAAGGRSRRTVEPAVVTSPATSNRSFTDTGRPARGEGTTPCLRRRSEASAAASALCACTLVKTRPPSPLASAMRASASSTSPRLLVLPSASDLARTEMATGDSAMRRLRLHIRVVIVQLQQQAARLGPERAVRRPRRAAGVGVGAEARPALAVAVAADEEIAGHHVHLLPVLVDEGLGRIHARLEAQVAGAETAPLLLVEITREHLLLDSGRIAGQALPAAAEVDLVKLPVLLADRHRWLLVSVSVGDRELADRVFVPQAAVFRRVVQLDLEALASADLAAHGERPAEHRGAWRQTAGRAAREQIARRKHVAHRALLVEPARAVARDVRTQHQPVPVRFELGERPKLHADRFRAHLLGHGDSVRLDLPVGVVRAHTDVKGVGRGYQHEFDFAARVIADDFHFARRREQARRDAVEDGYGARALDADRLELRDVLLHRRLVTPRPAGDDELRDLDRAPSAIDQKIHDSTRILPWAGSHGFAFRRPLE